MDRYLADVVLPDDPIRAFIGGGSGGPRDSAREHDRYLYRGDG